MESARTLFQSRDGSLWIGTSDGGLTCLKKGKFTAYNLETSPVFITSAAEDGNGDLWFATHHNGIIRLKDGKFTTYTTADGLPSNKVYALCTCKAGDLWVGTSAGLTKRTPEGNAVDLRNYK